MISIADAQGATAAAQDLVFKINDVFLFPLIALLSAIAFVVFLYGAFEYVRNSANQEGRQTGQRHLLYGIIGLLVMFSAFTLLQIAAGTFGVPVNQGVPTTNTLTGPGQPGFVPPPQGLSPQARSPENFSDAPGGAFGTQPADEDVNVTIPQTDARQSLSEQLRTDISDRIAPEDEGLLSAYHESVNFSCLSEFSSPQNCSDAVANLQDQGYISPELANEIVAESSRSAGLQQPDSPSSLPEVDTTSNCPAGTILLNGNCVTPNENTVDASPREVIAAEFQPLINQQIEAGQYEEVLEWYDPESLQDQATRVNHIQEVWPNECDSVNGEFRLLDTGSGGVWMCVR